MTEPSSTPMLVCEHISKRFGITRALDDVSVAFAAGEVHALMGENGAGKSTLGKVIAGLHRPDTGRVLLGGAALRSGSIEDAFAHGVRIVHQELAQCPNLTVAENLCLNDIPRTRLGFVDGQAMADRAARLLAPLEPRIDVLAPLETLSPGWRQICQIATALDDRSGDGGSSPRAIVFDEPTSSLSAGEVERLLEIVRELASRGLAVVYVSHRMGEIFACCDRVTVLRDGRFVATSAINAIDEPALVEQMIGRRLPASESVATPGGEAAALRSLAGVQVAEVKADAPVALRVEGVSSPGKLSDVSIAVRAGEVLGIGGLVGAGRSELLDAIFGLDPRARGRIELAGEPMAMGNPRLSIRSGIGYVPEDRRWQGLFFDMGINENIVLPVMASLAGPMGMRRLGAERELVDERIEQFQIKAASPASLPGELSGGNQQKLLIARWMSRDASVLLLDEPTRGIDVGTKAQIYQQIRAAAARGVAIVLVSSEMPELLALSDRVVVMADGRVAGEVVGDSMTQSRVLTLATRESAPA